MTHPTHEPDAESLLADCLDRDESEWAQAIDEACASHPAHADTLRRRFAMIAPEAEEATAPRSVPQQLGDFELGPILGSGGMGVVHQARDVRLGRDVAIKLLRPELLWFEGARDRFEREGQAVARLQHPSIVPVLSCGEVDGVPFYAMERVSGLALDEVLGALRDSDPQELRGEDVARVLEQRCGPLPDDGRDRLAGSWATFCTKALVQATDALAHAHSRGVLHRDLKPSNIMVRTDGRVQLLDFGLAAVAGSSKLTMTQGLVGSPPYMTPEQLADAGTDERSDVYGIGVTAYELLTLHCPFLRPTSEGTRRAILDAAADPIRQRLPGVSWELATVVQVAMDPDPTRRYASAAALRDDLDRVLNGDPIVARRPGRLLRARRWVQRHPTQTTAIGLGLVIAASIPTVLFIKERAAFEQQQEALARETELLGQANTALAAEREALDQLTQLADQIKVQQLLDREGGIWPPDPERLAALNGWVADAETLLDRRELHTVGLAALRKEAEPYSVEDQRRDAARAEPHLQKIDVLEERLAKPIDMTWGTNRKLVRQWQAELAEAKQHAAQRTWRFASVRQLWRHRELMLMLEELDRLEGRLDAVRDRLAKARSCEAETLVGPAAAWGRAREEVAADPRFEGYRLVARAGLVPLGADPASGLQEFAVWCTGEVPKRDENGELERGEHVAAVLVLIPGGTFTIGARVPESPGESGPNIDPMADRAEEPLQDITLVPYLIGKYEIHHRQWESVMERNPATTLPGDEVGPDLRYTADRPVDNVSWVEAREFCHRIGGELPTEAQWERAARGGTTTPWWAGDDPALFERVGNVCDLSVVNAGFNLAYMERNYDDGFVQAAPVGSFRANPYGLHDTIGNLDEWCLDALSAYTDIAIPGTGRFTMGYPESRSTRGGNFGSVFASTRSSTRGSASLDHRGNSLGLRPAMAAPVEPTAGLAVEDGGEPGQRTGK